MRLHRPCPVCGGRDRFYLVRHPRNGGAPFWKCRRCGYREPHGDETSPALVPWLTDEDSRLLLRVMAEAAERLRTDATAQRYLMRRGVDRETQRRLADMCTLGALGPGWMSALIRQERREHLLRGESEHESSHARAGFARLGFSGVTQAPSIVFGYRLHQRIVAVRGRRLPPHDSSVRYWSHRMMQPTTFFCPDPAIWACQTIGVTEGEIKAIVAYRAWKDGVISFPFVSVPGVAAWDDSWLSMLRGRHVVLAFDADANGAGQEAQHRIADILVDSGVRVSHIHLPLAPGQTKSDLDSYLLPFLQGTNRQIAGT